MRRDWNRTRRWLACAIAVGVLAWLFVRDYRPVDVATNAGTVEHRVREPGPAQSAVTARGVEAGLAVPTGLPRLADAPPGTDGPAPLSIERFEEARDEAMCGGLARCPGRRHDLPACLAMFAAFRRMHGSQYEDAVRAGKLTYDARAGARCVHAFGLCDAEELREAVCAHVFHGEGVVGALCRLREECASRVCSATIVSPYSKSGVCRAVAVQGKPSVDGGCSSDADCDAGTRLCIDGRCLPWGSTPGARCKYICEPASGLWCDVESKPAVCRERLAEGQACRPGSCAEGLFCLDTAAGPRCSKRLGEGQACEGSDTTMCEEGLYCTALATGRVCLRMQKAGGPCRVDDECGYELQCQGATKDGAGRCVGLPTEGEPCGSASPELRPGDWGCRSPFVCHPQRRLCVRELAEGDACPRRLCGMLEFDRSCVKGFCRSRLELGAACEDGEGVARCRSGLSCVGGHCAH